MKSASSTRKKKGEGNLDLSCSMKLRVYPTKDQELRHSDWLFYSHRFRNECVEFLNSRRTGRSTFIKKHPALARDWIPEEYAGSDCNACSKWLTARLKAAKLQVCQDIEGFEFNAKTMSALVSNHLRKLSRSERELLKDAWLLSMPRTVLDQVIRDLDKTLQKAISDRKERKKPEKKKIKCAGFPGFQKFQFTGSIRLQVVASKNKSYQDHWKAGELFVPGLGRLKFRDSGYTLPKTPPSLITVSRNAANQIHISFVCAAGESPAANKKGNLEADIKSGRHTPLPIDPRTGLPAIKAADLGLTHRSVDTDGKMKKRINYLKRSAPDLRKKNKSLARKQKGSSRYTKARENLGSTHVKVAAVRDATIRDEAQALVRDAAIVCLEDLSLGFMLKNRHLAGSAHDAALGKFKFWVEHECRKQGKLLIKCGRFDPSSKMCHECKHINHNLKLKDRTWVCPGCGVLLERDFNSSRNIRVMALEKAIKTLDCSTVPENGVGVLANYPLHPDLSAFIARGGLTALLEVYTSGESQSADRLPDLELKGSTPRKTGADEARIPFNPTNTSCLEQRWVG